MTGVNTPRDWTNSGSINQSKPVITVFRDAVIEDSFFLTEGEDEGAVFRPTFSHEI